MDPTYQKPNVTLKSFYSPLKEDLTITYRDEQNNPVEYIIPSMEVSTYPTFLADNFIKHIIDAVINERELGYLTPEKRAELQKEVEDMEI